MDNWIVKFRFKTGIASIVLPFEKIDNPPQIVIEEGRHVFPTKPLKFVLDIKSVDNKELLSDWIMSFASSENAPAGEIALILRSDKEETIEAWRLLDARVGQFNFSEAGTMLDVHYNGLQLLNPAAQPHK